MENYGNRSLICQHNITNSSAKKAIQPFGLTCPMPTPDQTACLAFRIFHVLRDCHWIGSEIRLAAIGSFSGPQKLRSWDQCLICDLEFGYVICIYNIYIYVVFIYIFEPPVQKSMAT